MTVYNKTPIKTHLEQPLFGGESISTARYDVVKHDIFEYLTEKQLSFFWRPEEIDISRDKNDYNNLTDHEKHIFTSNLLRQTVLDSVQGRAPVLAFLPECSLPELENWIITWSFSETIHSRSYTHIIRNIYPDPEPIFNEINNNNFIMDCATDISKYYDDYINSPNIETRAKALVAVNALEGIRFYVSFACSWAFAELKKMEGNAKIIQLIARDESLHLSSTQRMIQLCNKENDEFKKVVEMCYENIYMEVAEQEIQWAKYLFKDGAILGLNEKILTFYVQWLTNKRVSYLKLPILYNDAPKQNPLPWTEKWIKGDDVQPAPQETEITSYLVGSVKQDNQPDKFSDFSDI